MMASPQPRLTEQQQRAAVLAEAHTWLRTPYHPHGRVKGVGVDCGMLLLEVYHRAGIIPHVDPGNYPADWHLHRSEERYLAIVQNHGHEIALQQARAGDIVVFRFGRTWSHGGILVDDAASELLHAYRGLGVIISRLQDPPLASERANDRAPRAFSLWA